MLYSWDSIKSQVRQFRSNLHSIYPIQVWTITKDFKIHNRVLYFLSNNRDPNTIAPTAQLQLFKVHLDQLDLWADGNAFLSKQTEQYLHTLGATCPVLRKELAIRGLELYGENDSLQRSSMTQFDIVDHTMLFTWRDEHYVIPDMTHHMIPKRIPNTSTSDKNLKLGGQYTHLVAFVRDRDIWITDFEGNETQLTFCCLETEDPTLSCGLAEYMMQEEFHRLTGYEWRPICPDRLDCIAYLETTERDVEQITIARSTLSHHTHVTQLTSGQDAMSHLTATTNNTNNTQDTVRYPRPGQSNSQSEFKLVEFRWIDGYLQRCHKQLWGHQRIQAQFPWMEYIVRFGWLPDGHSLWLQLLSRDQKRTAVIRVFVSQFSATPTDAVSDLDVLWEETSSVWINVSDAFYFFKSSSHQLIWSSERDNGFRHLYLVEPSRIRALTSGEWCCLDRPLFVDEARSLVYFSAKLDSVLETHFYVLSLTHPSTPYRLTQLGFSHQVTMECPDYFVDCLSSLHSPPVTLVQRISQFQRSELALLMPVPLVDRLHSTDLNGERPPSPPPSNTQLVFDSEENGFLEHEKKPPHSIAEDYHDKSTAVEPNGSIFNFTTSDGISLYGCLYKPKGYEPGKSYPTLLHIYGGPKTQLVMNEFKFPRLMRYLMSVYFDFAVVVIDGRGSSDRGLRFESYLQSQLGQIELKDQLEGLDFLAQTKFGAVGHHETMVPVVDLNRLAITGWSYGGYLSLMALAQYPDRFKMAIAGAPVTEWELYDAAYTERYMGLPQENAAAYQKSNVLYYIDRFPANEHRLLIVHGLIDENVHFRNTERLVTELIRQNKPHYLQVYPTEKHGLRHASVNEHFETLMFYWLKNYL